MLPGAVAVLSKASILFASQVELGMRGEGCPGRPQRAEVGPNRRRPPFLPRRDFLTVRVVLGRDGGVVVSALCAASPRKAGRSVGFGVIRSGLHAGVARGRLLGVSHGCVYSCLLSVLQGGPPPPRPLRSMFQAFSCFVFLQPLTQPDAVLLICLSPTLPVL